MLYITSLLQQLPPELTAAIESGACLEQSPGASEPEAPSAAKARGRTYFYKLVRVESEGISTTVSLDPLLVARAAKVLGVENVNRVVREAAARYVKGMYRNRSSYCAAQLGKELLRQKQLGAQAQVAHD